MHSNITFHDVAPDTVQELLTGIAPAITPATLAPDRTYVQMAILPFYEDFKLYTFSDLRLPVNNEYYVLYKPKCAVLLDRTNVPIYNVNKLAPIKLTPETVIPYVRFFFSVVKSPGLPGFSSPEFIIVENPEDVQWLPNATDKERSDVYAHLMPITYNGIDSDGFLTLTATIMFGNALFRTDIKAAPCEIDAFDSDPITEEKFAKHFLIGELLMVNEELLLKNLNVRSAPPAAGTNDDGLQGAGGENPKDTSSAVQPYDGLPSIEGIIFTEIALDDIQAMKSDLERLPFPDSLSVDNIQIKAAELPFYDNLKLYTLTDTTALPPNVYLMLYGANLIGLMDRTNEPIYQVNEIAPILLSPETLPVYAKFFFYCVRGKLGRFIIVEKPEDVKWLPGATKKEKRAVAGHLMPLTYKGLDEDGMFLLTGTVIFKDALFRTDIKVAPQEMDVYDPETGNRERFTIGQIELANEELLLEDLNVPVDQQSDESP
jgi:hypothetical protein